MAVFFGRHFAYRIQKRFRRLLLRCHRLSNGERDMARAWTRKQRLSMCLGLALGVAIAFGSFQLFDYLLRSASWTWLRLGLAAVAVISCLSLVWPAMIVLAVATNVYCGITKEDPGHYFFEILLLPPVRKRVVRPKGPEASSG